MWNSYNNRKTNIVVPVASTIVLLVFIINSFGAEIDSPPCVYFNVSDCPTEPVCKCRRVDDASVVCCNIKTDFELKEGLNCVENHSRISALHIRNASLDKLDVNIVKFSKLVSLSVTDSRIPRLVNLFTSDLTCLNLSNNGLSEFDPRVISNLEKLKKIDLSHNNLTQLPDIKVHHSHFFIDIADNPQLLCESLSQLVSQYQDSSYSVHFLQENRTFCLQRSVFHWFNASDQVPLVAIKMKTKVEKACPHGNGTDGYKCACDIFRFEKNVYTVSVDCSNRRLTALPKPLPPFTVQLNVSYNNITQLDEVSIDSSYENLRYLYAQYNQIKSFTVLEGSRFMDSFVHLALQHNKIKTIPIYIIANALDRFERGDQLLNLGKNELHCDCNTAQVVKLWLISNKRFIEDYDDIWCDNVGEKVIDLDLNKVCIYQKDWIYYIHYIIAGEVFLLILLISKVSYDYWVFKSAGYLPWPASKMPKLPWEWVFE